MAYILYIYIWYTNYYVLRTTRYYNLIETHTRTIYIHIYIYIYIYGCDRTTSTSLMDRRYSRAVVAVIFGGSQYILHSFRCSTDRECCVVAVHERRNHKRTHTKKESQWKCFRTRPSKQGRGFYSGVLIKLLVHFYILRSTYIYIILVYTGSYNHQNQRKRVSLSLSIFWLHTRDTKTTTSTIGLSKIGVYNRSFYIYIYIYISLKKKRTIIIDFRW